ncbi:MAG TPA: hypothetical protein VFO85_07835 [Vicinamibacteria bacterium]|nr:hypothetical protein [Vicinamibacteria bacterium]
MGVAVTRSALVSAPALGKHCPSCGQVKPLDRFGVRRRSPSGRKSWCKACEAAAQQKRYGERVAERRCVRCAREAAAGLVVCRECCAKDTRSRATRRT